TTPWRADRMAQASACRSAHSRQSRKRGEQYSSLAGAARASLALPQPTRPRGGMAASFPDWSLLGGLLGLHGLVDVRGLAVAGHHAERLLQELAGLQAVGAGVAFGLHGRLARRRHDHLDDPLSHVPSVLAISRSTRANASCRFSTW